MRERTDEALMRAYAKGSLEAFDLLYSRHRGPLYRYVLRQVEDAATANDLYQGCWEKIIRARKRYRPSAPFRAWMFRIAHNHVMDYFRKTKPESEIAADDLEHPSPGPEKVYLDRDRTAELMEAVSRLPAEQREVLLLKLEGGFDIPAIAGITGVKPETAKSRLRYGVGKLKSELGEQ